MALTISLAGGLVVSFQSAPGQGIPIEHLQEDFQIMRRALEEAHGGIYRYTSKAEMDRTFDRAYRKIDHPMTELEFWRLAEPVVAHIKCGHTRLWFSDTLQSEFETSIPLFPLEVRLLGDHLYVYHDVAHPSSALEGSELLSINGVPTKYILKHFRADWTRDSNTRTAISALIGAKRLFGVDLYAHEIRSPFRVTYRRLDGKREAAELAGMTTPDWLKAKAKQNPEPDTNADLKFLDDGKIAVLTIRHWYDPERKVTFLDFLKKSFAAMQQNGSHSLIIDLRDNPGGLDAPGKELFAFLWDQPFYYDKDLVINAREFDFFKYAKVPPPPLGIEQQADGRFHNVKHPNWGLQQPLTPHFAGRVYALMNGGSFSTSCEFLSMLHFHKRATFIGEEAAGGYYGCTAGWTATLTLPYSKLVLPIGLVTYYQAVSGYKYPDRGVMPDYPVAHTIADLLAGRDRDMELAISLARPNQHLQATLR
jgi:hypothetical protein